MNNYGHSPFVFFTNVSVPLSVLLKSWKGVNLDNKFPLLKQVLNQQKIFWSDNLLFIVDIS